MDRDDGNWTITYIWIFELSYEFTFAMVEYHDGELNDDLIAAYLSR